MKWFKKVAKKDMSDSEYFGEWLSCKWTKEEQDDCSYTITEMYYCNVCGYKETEPDHICSHCGAFMNIDDKDKEDYTPMCYGKKDQKDSLCCMCKVRSYCDMAIEQERVFNELKVSCNVVEIT